MQATQDIPVETQALRRCVRDLAALSTLSAVWSRSDLREIAEGLGTVLFQFLPLPLVYVRVSGFNEAVAVEVARTPQGLLPVSQTQEIGSTLEPLLKNGASNRTATIPNPFGSGSLRLVITPLGCAGDCGVLVAGSQQPEFPSQTDRLILGVGANQAAIVLQQRRAEDQLRRREQELSDFFDNATMGLHWVGPDGIILRANKAELELLGYSADEYIGRHIAEFHADKDVIEDILQRLCAGETLRDYEARLRCKDGSIKHVLIDSSVLWEDGEFVHTRCFTRDITDRKRSDEALRESEARKAAMVETALDGIISIDHEGKVIEFNPAAERTFGYRSDEVLGREMAELVIPPSLREAHRSGMARYLASGQGRVLNQRLELTAVRADGSEFPVEVAITRITTNDPPIFTGYIRDISDQKRAENTRRKQGERLQLLWEAAAVLLTADDPNAMLRGLHAKIGPHLGVDTYFNFLVNDSGDALRLASCEGIPVETARTITRLEFGQAVCGTVALHRQPIVATHIQQSGDPKVQLVKSFGLRAYACNPLLAGDRLLGTLSFASRTKDQFDPDEVAFLETICHYVTVAYERLRLLNELKEADRHKDEFLATLAHELRNPLAAVRNAVQIMKRTDWRGTNAERGKSTVTPFSPLTTDRPPLDIVERQVGQIVRLVDDLLDVSRISRGKIELRREPVELASVVNHAVEATRSLVESMEHILTVNLPPEPIYLNADPTRLAQVVSNLLNNACKFMNRRGRLWLTVETEAVKDQETGVRIQKSGNPAPGSSLPPDAPLLTPGLAVIRVRDTGIGLPDDQLHRIFEIFAQVDVSLERARDGLGLGLSLVKKLVELHDGTVEARSAGLGQGSEFVVRLPIATGELSAATGQPESPSSLKTPHSPLATRHRILVVDDNRDSAESLAMLLQIMGHEVDTAHDGLEAIARSRTFRADIMLLDIGMPRLNGYETARRLREQQGHKALKLVALTGWGQSEDRRRSEEAGFDAHLVKPVDVNAITELLAEWGAG